MLKEKVVKHYGSQRAISAALGVSDSAVSQWGEVIPERIALKLSRITDGVLVYDPSFYKSLPRQQPKPQKRRNLVDNKDFPTRDDISEAIHKLITLFPSKYSAMAKQLDPVAGTENALRNRVRRCLVR